MRSTRRFHRQRRRRRMPWVLCSPGRRIASKASMRRTTRAPGSGGAAVARKKSTSYCSWLTTSLSRQLMPISPSPGSRSRPLLSTRWPSPVSRRIDLDHGWFAFWQSHADGDRSVALRSAYLGRKPLPFEYSRLSGEKIENRFQVRDIRNMEPSLEQMARSLAESDDYRITSRLEQ